MKKCGNARELESGKAVCEDSSMVLHVGLYCDPDKCEKVRKGEVKPI